MAEITKAELIEYERAAWREVMKRIDFMTELSCAKAEKVLTKDASVKLADALNKFRPLFKQRLAVELGKY